jgi:hypothetical protein
MTTTSVEAGTPLGPVGAVTRALRHLVPHVGLWLMLACLCAVNMVWLGASPRLSVAPPWPLIWAGAVALIPLLVLWREWRGAVFDRFLSLMFHVMLAVIFAALMMQQLGLFNHLAMSLPLPLQDERLMAWDRALGFDWNHYANLVAGTAWGRELLIFAYNSLINLVLGTIIVVALWLGRVDRVNELAFLTFASGLVCVTVAALFPALSAWFTVATPQTRAMIGGQPGLEWIDQFHALRGSEPVIMDIPRMEGLATFPSFHTCLGLIMAWCSRGRWTGAILGGLSGLAVIAATPVFGGHYLIDLLGGAVVMAGVILLWRRIAPHRRSGRGRP